MDSPYAYRRDSALIKEEIKSFLANRRISQAVVAQVTGENQLHLPVKAQTLTLLMTWIWLRSSPFRHQPEPDLPLALAAGIRPKRAEETGLLPLVPAGKDQPR